jgi:hypothetical protein
VLPSRTYIFSCNDYMRGDWYIRCGNRLTKPVHMKHTFTDRKT